MPFTPTAKPTQSTLFEETQWSPVWVFALLVPAALLAVVVAAIGLWRDGSAAMALPIAALLLTGNVLCVKTCVDDQFLLVTFGAIFPLYRRRIARGEIASAQAVIYDPIGEYGGWGIRGFKGDQCLNARGNEGVRLTLANGDKLLVGSARPGELAATLSPTS